MPKKNGMMLGEEVSVKVRENLKTKTKFPDGAIKYVRKECGFWEVKDSNDELEAEIIKKFNLGYPQFNILFEDSKTAILYQAQERHAKGTEVLRADMKDRQKYEQNLKRGFPRILFYSDFWQWANWGRKLMDLHLNYETIPILREMKYILFVSY